MARNRGDVDVVLDHVERRLADDLHRVGMEDDALLVADLPDFANRLEHADLVVRGHDGDENRLVIDGAFQVLQINEAVCFHRQIRHAVAVFLKPLTGIQHRFVLCDLSDDVVAAFAIHFSNALDGKVVALGCSRRR